MDYVDGDRICGVVLMHADIDTKMADKAYKKRLTDYEPWKLMVCALTASAAMFGSIGGVLGYLLRGVH